MRWAGAARAVEANADARAAKSLEFRLPQFRSPSPASPLRRVRHTPMTCGPAMWSAGAEAANSGRRPRFGSARSAPPPTGTTIGRHADASRAGHAPPGSAGSQSGVAVLRFRMTLPPHSTCVCRSQHRAVSRSGAASRKATPPRTPGRGGLSSGRPPGVGTRRGYSLHATVTNLETALIATRCRFHPAPAVVWLRRKGDAQPVLFCPLTPEH